MYTVKEVSEISKVTVKTLHHYHKLGLLIPGRISESGYRLYGTPELERLQQILFYKELDFPLAAIKQLLDGEPDRLEVLQEQRTQLVAKAQRLNEVVRTLDISMISAMKGEAMNPKDMFSGLAGEEEWREALAQQEQYLKDTYNYEMLGSEPIEVEEMNAQAKEAAHFMNSMAESLRGKVRHDDSRVTGLIRNHLEFLSRHGHSFSPADFAEQTRFFMQDDFHREMLESQQTGLAYYLGAAASAYADGE
ncbi:MerR family transcriptional regulator [Paenibacillus sp. J22TS3]|uniref:MerR family transcriptional regulator n=1 Tax=Paenibacillus sp. J22TS3 TaxID=2807192 RepID=UPI001B102BA6|nr:MerR family transcriptional regulator [Paenibacillus sp. J22TS3]GIP23764.1 MerR family transcriptional regulator [Paenibacillus sp. J22TS3]